MMAMTETIMEHLAMELNMSSLNIRLANMDAVENESIIRFMNEFTQYNNYNIRLQEIIKFNKENRWIKKGLSLVPMTYSIAYIGKCRSTVVIYAGDGSVAVSHSGIEMGQGINTKVAQVCAYTLGIPLEKVKIKYSNVVISPNTFTTGASITSEEACYATLRACETLIQRIQPVRDQMKNASWPELIKACQEQYINLSATHMFSPNDPPIGYDIYNVCITEVQVDILTGSHLVNRVDLLEDVGNSTSPLIDIGQVEGAFIMGLGYWTTEEIVFDKNGKLMTNRTWNYKPPSALDIPVDFRVKFPKNNPNPNGILHSKATAEPSLCLSCSIPIAIRQAVASARMSANSNASKWYPIDGPSTVENTFMNSLNNFQQYTL